MVEFGTSLWEWKLRLKDVVTTEDYEYFLNVKIVPSKLQHTVKLTPPLPSNLSDCLTTLLKVQQL